MRALVFTKGATLISVDLDNGLIAQSELGTLALIDKKDFGGVSITINPGPGGGPDTSGADFVGSGLLGILGLDRHSPDGALIGSAVVPCSELQILESIKRLVPSVREQPFLFVWGFASVFRCASLPKGVILKSS